MSEMNLHVSSTDEVREEDYRWFFQNLRRILANEQTTGGNYFMSELSAPAGDSPPLHLHHHEEEAFYILEGQMTVWCGDQEPIILNKGDYAIMPRGIPHTYKVTSQTEARFLSILSPAREDGFEGFVREISRPAETRTLPPPISSTTPEEMKRIKEIGDKYGIPILGPPGMLPTDLKE